MSKLQLAVGQVWKTRGGKEILVTDNPCYPNKSDYPFKDANGCITFLENGRWCKEAEDFDDLIELVQDENGWRPWKATADSQCPVNGDLRVHIRVANGHVSSEESPCFADDYVWRDAGSASIVAYKIVEEATKPVATSQEPDARRHSHYFKDVSQIDEIDVYRVCDLFEVDDPSGATQHAVKKLLCAGRRGAKGRKKDYQEAIDTLTRRLAMWEGE